MARARTLESRFRASFVRAGARLALSLDPGASIHHIRPDRGAAPCLLLPSPAIIMATTTGLSQEEMNEYLQSKNVNPLFVQIVEAMLIEQPENPKTFIFQ